MKTEHHESVEYADGERDDKTVKTMETDAKSTDGSTDDDAFLKNLPATDAQGYKEGERKKGVLRKLNLHKV